VAAYRSQFSVEADFRQMKDPKVVGFSPMFHWTDSKIRVHAQYCVLALCVARPMTREAKNAGIAMSVRELLSTLAGIEETVMHAPPPAADPVRSTCSPRWTLSRHACTNPSTSPPTRRRRRLRYYAATSNSPPLRWDYVVIC